MRQPGARPPPRGVYTGRFVYGNDGRDSLATRDGKRDKAHGGAGTDSASVDGRDTTVSVERVSRR